VRLSIGGGTGKGSYGPGTKSTPQQMGGGIGAGMSTPKKPPADATSKRPNNSFPNRTTGKIPNRPPCGGFSTPPPNPPFALPSFYSCPITFNGQSCSTSLSGGVNEVPYSLSTPYVTLYSYNTLGNLTCAEQHGTATSGTGCSAAPSNDAASPWRVRRFIY